MMTNYWLILVCQLAFLVKSLHGGTYYPNYQMGNFDHSFDYENYNDEHEPKFEEEAEYYSPNKASSENDSFELSGDFLDNLDYFTDLDTILTMLKSNQPEDKEMYPDHEPHPRLGSHMRFERLIVRPVPQKLIKETPNVLPSPMVGALMQLSNEGHGKMQKSLANSQMQALKPSEDVKGSLGSTPLSSLHVGLEKSHALTKLLASNTFEEYWPNPKEAHCKPQKKEVNLGFSNEGSLIRYYPKCVRVKRCGGCCSAKSTISCQPLAKKNIVVKVLQIKQKPSTPGRHITARKLSKRQRRSKYNKNVFNVTVEEHTECTCMCNNKESSCNPSIHKYDLVTCSCNCLNEDEENKCSDKAHFWDSRRCKCMCRYSKKCSTGEGFDHKTCTCKERRRDLWSLPLYDAYF